MIRHLVRGLRILGERWWARPRRWVAAGTNWLDTGLRLAMLAGGGWALAQLLLGSLLRVGVVALVVCVLALRAATKAARGAPQEVPRAAAKKRPEVSREEFLAFVWESLGDARAVHLATLADRLTALSGDRWTGEDVRALCRTHGVALRQKVRDLGGDRVSSGVHRDDLEPLPQPLPEGVPEGVGGGYVAGGGGNATPLQGSYATAPTPTVRRVGDLRITSVDDPDNPARTHVSVTDPARKRSR